VSGDAPVTAFVLGAGLGTRLRPLTNRLPKPLLPVFGRPIITFALDHLRAAGVRSFVINTHYLAPRFDEVFGSGIYEGCPVKLVHEADLLDTGGGIKNAEPWIGHQPFVVYSGDLLSDIDLERLIEEHLREKNDVTMALRETKFSAPIAFESGRVTDINGRYGKPGSHDFANVSVWNPDIFQRIPAGKKISFVPIVADWIGQNGRIGGVVLNDRGWFNIGSREEYLDVHRLISEGGWKPDYVRDSGWPSRIGENVLLAKSARLSGFCSAGANCSLGESAVIENSVLWPGAKIADGARLRGCVVAENVTVSGNHEDEDLTEGS